MKKLSFFILTALAFLPVLALAAYDTVTLTTSTIINVGGVNLSVSGGSAEVESIVVGADSFSVTLLPSSSMTIVSGDRRTLTPSVPNSDYVRNTCSESSSSLILTADPAVSTVTITVTPSASACSTAASAGGGSSGGGGGIAGSYGAVNTNTAVTIASPAVTVASVTTTTSTAQTTSSGSQVTSSYSFTRPISLGARGNDVTELQKRLIAEGLLSAKPTGYFGQQTLKAVKALQAKYNLAQIGTVGPATRALLNSLVKTGTETNTAMNTATPNSTSFNFTVAMRVGSRGTSVTELQKILINQGFLSAKPTGYFGKQTEAAVRAYQTKNGLSAVGIVGPATRALLNKGL